MPGKWQKFNRPGIATQSLYTWNPPAVERDLSFEIRSVYRGLLRETSYLPDSVARAYTYGRIKSRFRANRGKAKKDPDVPIETGFRRFGKGNDFDLQRLRKARSSKNMLEKANNGDLDSLKKVFMLVYGRQGERKRALLRKLLRPDEGVLPVDDSALQKMIERPTGVKSGTWRPDQKLYNFIKSQQANQPVEADRKPIKHIKPKIPKENSWGRPLAGKLQESMVKKWWVVTLEKLLPPIPRNEWERLRDLATGVMPLEERPAWRIPINAPPQPLAKEIAKKMTNEQILEYFKTPARIPESEMVRMAFDPEEGLVIHKDANIQDVRTWPIKIAQTEQIKLDQKLQGLAIRAERKNPEPEPKSRTEGEMRMFRDRSLRRLYATIWSLTPTMEYDASKQTWNIEWGGQKSRAFDGVISKPSKGEEELFEGLDQLPQNTGPGPAVKDVK